MDDIKNIIELSNIEIHEHCMLNTRTGEKEYNKGNKKMPCFTGLYFKDENTFLHYTLQKMGLSCIMVIKNIN